jgi:hypothetical protein
MRRGEENEEKKSHTKQKEPKKYANPSKPSEER